MSLKLRVNIKKLKENILNMKEHLREKNIEMVLVTKMFSANNDILKEIDDLSLNYIGESRIESLKKLSELKTKKMLIRTPSMEEIEDLARYADRSVHTNIYTVKELDKYLYGPHLVDLMVEMGDLREGYYSKEELFSDIQTILNLKYVKLNGIGMNLTCLNGVISTKQKIDYLRGLKSEIEDRFNLKNLNISAGNSSAIVQAYSTEDFQGLELRLGEGIYLARDTVEARNPFNLNEDVFALSADLIELKEKPREPYEDKEVDCQKMLRGILNIGKACIDLDLRSLNENVEIIGATSDHMVVEVKDRNIKLFDELYFSPGYGSLVKIFSTSYVEIELEDRW